MGQKQQTEFNSVFTEETYKAIFTQAKVCTLMSSLLLILFFNIILSTVMSPINGIASTFQKVTPFGCTHEVNIKGPVSCKVCF